MPKNKNKFSIWQEMSIDVPRGSMFSSLLFKIFINDLWIPFLTGTNTLCNYADDNIMYSSDKNTNIVIIKLKYDFVITSE